MLSLAFTDHYFDRASLKRIGADIAVGERPQLDPTTKEKLLPAVQEAKKLLGLGRRTRPKLAGGSSPTAKNTLRVILLSMAVPIILSSTGPLYYGYTNGPYWRVIVWAIACTVGLSWLERSSFKSALSPASPSMIGRSLIIISIVVVTFIAFFVGDSLLYLFARSL
jgi:hypothetical protein